MNFLLINSNEDSFIAYSNGGKIDISYSSEFLSEESNQKSPDMLINCLSEITKRNKIDLENVNAIAVTVGPGSFTGIRVGLSISKALGISLNTKLIPINNFELTLHRLGEITEGIKYCVLIKSKSSEFYYSLIENYIQREYGLIGLHEIESLRNKCSVIVNDFTKESIVKLPYFEYVDISEFLSERDSMLGLTKMKYENNLLYNSTEIKPFYLSDFKVKDRIHIKLV